MSEALTTEAVRELLASQFEIPAQELEDDTLLFSSGRLDSFHLVELLALLEKQTGSRITPGDVNLENFDTPQRIASLLARSS
jgi:acyl carrier protein